MDADDEAWLSDGETQRHIDAAAEAHRRADAGEDVDWDTVIDEHILG